MLRTSRFYTPLGIETRYSDDTLRNTRFVRIKIEISIFKELESEWDTLTFIHRAEIQPSLFIETFWEQIRFLVKETYERFSNLYGLHYTKHFHDVYLQVE